MNEQIENLIKKQKDFFRTGYTLDIDNRIEMLRSLKYAVEANQDKIAKALKEDLGKNVFSSYMTEIGTTLEELDFMLRHTKNYAKDKTVYTPLAQMVGRSYVKASPYGCVLVMSPWNYPFLLSLAPMVDAVSAGNTVILKPSAYAKNTSEFLAEMFEKLFPKEYLAVVTGGRKENSELLDSDFDYIFFTGSVGVGKEVMKKASERLIPITLELGGKSPCIVDETADLGVAARRIVFGAFLNCGQTCVAPDYVLCDEKIKDELVGLLIEETIHQYSENAIDTGYYGRIINEKHFKRILGLIDPQKTVFGGQSDEKTLQIAPTIMTDVTLTDPVMGEEIFGPVLPVLTFVEPEEIYEIVRENPDPLALYLFSKDKKMIEDITSRIQFGGGCINDTIIQLATSEMGFGGVGQSGMGAYHGKAGFDTFTHYKSLVHKVDHPDFPFRYEPYDKFKELLVRLLLK